MPDEQLLDVHGRHLRRWLCVRSRSESAIGFGESERRYSSVVIQTYVRLTLSSWALAAPGPYSRHATFTHSARALFFRLFRRLGKEGYTDARQRFGGHTRHTRRLVAWSRF